MSPTSKVAKRTRWPQLGRPLLAASALACAPPPAVEAPAPKPTDSATPAPASATAPEQPGTPRPEALTCGSLRCWSFESPERALERVLQEPVDFLAIGETHAQKGHAELRSTTQRFREELLPKLPPFKALLLEVLLPPMNCPGQDKKEAAVREETDQVVQSQSADNQSEFLRLANAAKEQGIVPFPLRLQCEDLDALSNSEDKLVELLSWIAERSRDRALALQKQGSAPVLLYGGALHNDVVPRPGRENWSFGPALSARGRYVELDLITREFVAERPPWTDQTWFDAYRAVCDQPGTLLIEQGPQSFVLLLPWQGRPVPCPAKEAAKEAAPETP